MNQTSRRKSICGHCFSNHATFVQFCPGPGLEEKKSGNIWRRRESGHEMRRTRPDDEDILWIEQEERMALGAYT